MFAFHTPTRMKGSLVVQGLKSWASALHPQLPLSGKESQRLLNALTSSFRRQLDEAHPPHENGDSRPQVGGKGPDIASKPQSQGLHSSSAVHADKHMASVLTSPLFAQGKVVRKPDVANVMVELQKNPGKDPIELLEEYHEKGNATIPIAVTCLELFKKSLEGLPAVRRKAVVDESATGKRTLLWVWQNKIYESEQFIENVRLAELMVPFVVEEGYEKYLWEWLAMDMPTADPSALPAGTPHMKAQRHPYRWQSLIIRNIVAAKVEGAPNLDSALEVLFCALDLEKSWFIPLASSWVYLRRALRQKSLDERERRIRTNPALYDRFIGVGRDARFASNNKALSDQEACDLYLMHPTHPTPLPALALLKRAYHRDEQRGDWEKYRALFTYSRRVGSRRADFVFFARTLRQLEDTNRVDDAAWVRATCQEVYPEFDNKLEDVVQQDRAQETEAVRRVLSPAVETSDLDKVVKGPMPSFAF